MGYAEDYREWLEADGLGGFASGTVSGIRTRRYHALLLCAVTPPAGRVVLVNGLEAWVETPSGTFAISSQRYTPDVVHPDGARRIARFEDDPWPRWSYAVEDGTQIEQECFVTRGAPVVALSWRLRRRQAGVTLFVRPLLSGRDLHALHHENPVFRFNAQVQGDRVIWHPYASLPRIIARANGTYAHEPVWYRNFRYDEELARGLDWTEDLVSPGLFRWDLSQDEAVLLFGALDTPPLSGRGGPSQAALRACSAEERRRRGAFPSRLHRAADAYLVHRGRGRTIIAGYPWFGDWGRDTFIALRGLCLATGRLEEARSILLGWSGAVSDGMLPNRFPDHGEAPEFNAVDAALWYVVAVHEFLQAAEQRAFPIARRDAARLHGAVDAILAGYAKGTRFHIRLDEDGLLSAGEPGVQLTWMDAKIGDWVVTPRIGKPVEVEALWLNALWIGSERSPRWKEIFLRGREVFRRRFWNDAGGFLYDVIDVNHEAWTADAAFRPNQIFAVGGLPLALLDGAKARRVVEAVETRLWTPLGLRSLAPQEPGYAPRYEGGVRERDGAYHQGTVWPWLLGPFVEAWVRARGNSPQARREARARFLAPLLRHLDGAGLGHLSEITDGELPHAPRGCPFQAWSAGEALRLSLVVLAAEAPRARPARRDGGPVMRRARVAERL